MKISYNNLFSILLICLLGCIVYSNTFTNAFHFDDKLFILSNQSIKNIADPAAIWNFWPTRFVAFFSFAINYYLNGFNSFGYHLVNLVIHLAAAISVWWLVRLIFTAGVMQNSRNVNRSNFIALFSAIIFVVHPIQTEAVTYIVQRTTSLAGFLFILSVCLYVKSRLLFIDNNLPGEWKWFYALSILVGIMSMFTKENTVTLPLIIVLCEFFFFNSPSRPGFKFTALFFILLPVIPLTLFFAHPPTFIDIQTLASQPIAGGQYFFTQLRVIVTYLRLLFIPINQNLDYDYPVFLSWINPQVLLSFLLLLGILFIAVKLFSKHRLISFAIFWFFITLIPESSIIPLSDLIFEHRLYLPSLGYCLFLVSALYYLFRKENHAVLCVVLGLVCAVYGLMSYSRNFDWRDGVLLWDETVQKSAQKPRPYFNRGAAYAELKNDKEAVIDFAKCLLFNYIKIGKGNDFSEIWNEITKASKNPSEMYYPLGVKFTEIGMHYEASNLFVLSLKNPSLKNKTECYINLCAAFGNMGKFNQAIEAGEKAVALAPQSALAHYNLAMAYHFIRKPALAFKHMKLAQKLGLNPDPEFEE